MLQHTTYTRAADMANKPLPLLHLSTKQPVRPDDLSALFPLDRIHLEVTPKRYVEINKEVQRVYRIYRPSPLIRAKRKEKTLRTPAKITFTCEGVSSSGPHKPTTALPAWRNIKQGVKQITTETGAGQWGTGSTTPPCSAPLTRCWPCRPEQFSTETYLEPRHRGATFYLCRYGTCV